MKCSLKKIVSISAILLLAGCQQKATTTSEDPAYGPGAPQVSGEVSSAGDNYAPVSPISVAEENSFDFVSVAAKPFSTVSADVDTASLTRARAQLNAGVMPDPESIRIEDFINYANYSYTEPSEGGIVSIKSEEASSPWTEGHRILKIGMKTRTIAKGEIASGRNLVFLLDVSGSMSSGDGLPLLKASVEEAIANLLPTDRISIVTYAGRSSVLIDGGSAAEPQALQQALNAISNEGGGTNGAAGIKTAYELAQKHFIAGGVNRVILGTDGDFNVGVTSTEELKSLTEQQAGNEIYLTVLGFRAGAGGDSMLERVSNDVNGSYFFIDSKLEAARVLGEKIDATLVTVAKDLKIQLEFNPRRVASYRLIGYSNRILSDEDFGDDKKDAGDLGSSHQVTYLFEYFPQAADASFVSEYEAAEGVAAPIYQANGTLTAAAAADEAASLSLRFKTPGQDESQLLNHRVAASDQAWASSSVNFQTAVHAAAFAAKLARIESIPFDPVAAQQWFAQIEASEANSENKELGAMIEKFIALERED